MTVERVPGTFRQALSATGIPAPYLGIPGVNVADAFSPSVLTPGATIIDTVDTDSAYRKWQLVAYSIVGQLALSTDQPPITMYGRLGRIDAAIVTDGANPTGTITAILRLPFTNPELPFPSEFSTAMPIFDPATDSLPPTSAGAGQPIQTVAFGRALILSTPIQMQSIDRLGIGIWISPSFLNNDGSRPCVSLVVANARYTLSFEP